jgi:hypothetical protein
VAESSRALLCDGLAASCEFANNFIDTGNNRALRYRAFAEAGQPGPVSWHDNRLDNIAHSTIAAVHLCDPDTGGNNANGLDIYANTFVLGPEATAVMVRGCLAPGPAVRGNTFECAVDGCVGAQLASLRFSDVGTHLTLGDNHVDPGIAPATLEAGTVLHPDARLGAPVQGSRDNRPAHDQRLSRCCQAGRKP